MATNQTPADKKIEKVTKGEVIIRKKSSFAKIRDMFISDDADKVGSYIVMDVLVPSIKRAIVDIIKSSADMIFGTKSTPSNTTKYSYGGNASYISYGNSQKDKPQRDTNSYYSPWDFSYVEFSRLEKAEDNKRDADEVITTMCDMISSYGNASVADLCEIIGVPYEHTAYDYGWKNLVQVVPIKIPGTNGYYLRFPKATPIDKN